MSLVLNNPKLAISPILREMSLGGKSNSELMKQLRQ